MRGEHIPETEEYGISSFVYEARMTLSPREVLCFSSWNGKIWKADSFERVFLVSYTTAVCWAMESGRRNSKTRFCRNVLESYPKKDWPVDEEYLSSIKESWVEPFGEMRQELVFIGRLNKKA